MEILLIITWALFGFWGSSMAKNRGRNQVVGAIMGVLFGILAIIGYAIAGDTEQKKQDRLQKILAESPVRYGIARTTKKTK